MLGFIWQLQMSWVMVGYLVGLLVGSPLLEQATGQERPSFLEQAYVYSSMIAFLSMPTEMPVIFDDSTKAWSFEISFGVAFF
jgi:hypothetical protein